MNKTAVESHRILVELYSEQGLAEQTCQKWFARFKSGDFGLEDEERPGQPKKFLKQFQKLQKCYTPHIDRKFGLEKAVRNPAGSKEIEILSLLTAFLLLDMKR